MRLIEELLASGTGPNGDLVPADLARLSSKRRTESKKANGQYSLSAFCRFFGSSKYVFPLQAGGADLHNTRLSSSTMLTILGGKIKDLRPFLLEERIPDGWQPRVLHPMGLTMAEFNKTVMQVELGIKEELPKVFGFSESDTPQKKKVM